MSAIAVFVSYNRLGITVMRQAVIELGKLGPLLPSERIIREHSGRYCKYEKLIVTEADYRCRSQRACKISWSR